MWTNESFFRLFSVALLGAIFISMTAFAEKAPVKKGLFSTIEHIEEAETINNNKLHASNLTTIGDRVEIIAPIIQTQK